MRVGSFGLRIEAGKRRPLPFTACLNVLAVGKKPILHSAKLDLRGRLPENRDFCFGVNGFFEGLRLFLFYK
jgi:hypothetical protein